MSPVFLLLALLSAGQHGSAGATACWTSCQRHVTDGADRPRVCRVCVMGGAPESWVDALAEDKPSYKEALDSALKDGDWRVRWAAVRARAKVRRVSEPRALAEWVAAAPTSEELSACLTAARAAGEGGQTVGDFLKGSGPRASAALARVAAHREDIRRALEVELYAENVAERGRALAHLAVLVGRPPARVVLDAMASRPESADEAVARALIDTSERQLTSVGRMLLAVAKPADEARVNRLFAVYSRELEALQPDLASGDVTKRRAAVLSLRRYGPLAGKELSRALVDPDAQVSQHAARGLAEVEGLSVVEAARKRLRPEADLAAQRPWLQVVARERGGAELLLAVAEDGHQPAPVRGEAVAMLGACEDVGREQRLGLLTPYLTHALPPLRAGAVRALDALPWGAGSKEALVFALDDSAPEVLVAALGVVAARRQTSQVEVVVRLLGSESPEVREASARALEAVGRAQHVPVLAMRLREDPAAAVRVAAAHALGVLGGAQSVAALTEASEHDADTHVQHVAREALQRLGFLHR